MRAAIVIGRSDSSQGEAGPSTSRTDVVIMNSRKMLTAATAVGASVAVAGAMPLSAEAAQTVPAHGSFTITSTITGNRVVDGVTLLSVTQDETLTGTIAGDRVSQGIVAVQPDGSFTVADSGEFS